MSEHDDCEPEHAASPTDQISQELQLYGFRPSEDEDDPRPVPEDRIIAGAVADIFDALISTVAGTSLDPDLGDLLWSTVNTFHRAVERAERDLDDNVPACRHLGGLPRDGSRNTPNIVFSGFSFLC